MLLVAADMRRRNAIHMEIDHLRTLPGFADAAVWPNCDTEKRNLPIAQRWRLR